MRRERTEDLGHLVVSDTALTRFIPWHVICDPLHLFLAPISIQSSFWCGIDNLPFVERVMLICSVSNDAFSNVLTLAYALTMFALNWSRPFLCADAHCKLIVARSSRIGMPSCESMARYHMLALDSASSGWSCSWPAWKIFEMLFRFHGYPAMRTFKMLCRAFPRVPPWRPCGLETFCWRGS